MGEEEGGREGELGVCALVQKEKKKMYTNPSPSDSRLLGRIRPSVCTGFSTLATRGLRGCIGTDGPNTCCRGGGRQGTEQLPGVGEINGGRDLHGLNGRQKGVCWRCLLHSCDFLTSLDFTDSCACVSPGFVLRFFTPE